MKYLEMRPEQIRAAIKNNVPVLFPLGVVEYHGEHLPLGTDAFVAIDVFDRIEKKHPEVVVLPPYYYGAASYAVAAPEGNGTIQVDSAHIIPVAEDIFKSLLRVGFRNIHAFIAHQTEEFYQGMPTDLAFRFAARHTIFEWLEKETGEGWWGTEQFSQYYSGDNNPFAWIQIHSTPYLNDADRITYKGDHAGRMETSEDMAMYPDCVKMDALDGNLWYCRPGKDGTKEFGEEALEYKAKAMEYLLFGRISE